MSFQLGMNCKLYRNTGTYSSPTWDEIGNVRDLTLTLETADTDVTTRMNAGWEAIVATLRRATIEWEMIWDATDADFTAIRQAFLTAGTIELLVLSGPVNVANSQGLRATCMITRFDRTEPLTDAVKVKVSAKPTYSVNAPSWYVAS